MRCSSSRDGLRTSAFCSDTTEKFNCDRQNVTTSSNSVLRLAAVLFAPGAVGRGPVRVAAIAKGPGALRQHKRSHSRRASNPTPASRERRGRCKRHPNDGRAHRQKRACNRFTASHDPCLHEARVTRIRESAVWAGGHTK
eukprot:359258-Chlamydomonas_euryale.AAC.14